MSIELALAIPPAIDLCFHYGRELRRLCAIIKNADTAFSECLLRLDNGWIRFETQLELLKQVQHLMNEEHRSVYERTLAVFLSKLEFLTSILDRLARPDSNNQGDGYIRTSISRKLKFAWKKESLDQSIEDFETWQRIADQSWFLLLRIADPGIDRALKPNTSNTAAAIPSTLTIRAGLQGDVSDTPGRSGLSLSAENIRKMDIAPIPFCCSLLAVRTNSAGQVSTFILNRVERQPAIKSLTVQTDVRDLARRLQHDEPDTFGLLTCKGFVVDRDENGPDQQVEFTLVFRGPAFRCNPRSLRALLLQNPASVSVSFRLEIAKQLAKSVGYVHTFGFVHKGVRPESIIGFNESKNGKSPLMFLVGFENFRRDQGQTARFGDEALDRNLYRHPSRQGYSPEEEYVMQHDIYSLGVCLLEVGLWESFIHYDMQNMGTTASPVLCLPAQLDPAKAGAYLKASGKDHILSLAQTQLPQRMGTRYTEIVQTCLTCLDPDNDDFGDQHEFQDDDGIVVGARYIEKVIVRLHSLCI